MRAGPVLLRQNRHQLLFGVQDVFRVRQPDPVGYAEDVGVDRDRVSPHRHRIDDVGRLSSHARERAQFFQRARHFSVKARDDIAASAQNMLRLAVVEPAGKDLFAQFLLGQRKHFFRRAVFRKEFRRDAVDALVRALRGQDYGDQQLKLRFVSERGLVRIDAGKRLYDFFCGLFFHRKFLFSEYFSTFRVFLQ